MIQIYSTCLEKHASLIPEKKLFLPPPPSSFSLASSMPTYCLPSANKRKFCKDFSHKHDTIKKFVFKNIGNPSTLFKVLLNLYDSPLPNLPIKH